MHSETL